MKKRTIIIIAMLIFCEPVYALEIDSVFVKGSQPQSNVFVKELDMSQWMGLLEIHGSGFDDTVRHTDSEGDWVKSAMTYLKDSHLETQFNSAGLSTMTQDDIYNEPGLYDLKIVNSSNEEAILTNAFETEAIAFELPGEVNFEPSKITLNLPACQLKLIADKLVYGTKIEVLNKETGVVYDEISVWDVENLSNPETGKYEVIFLFELPEAVQVGEKLDVRFSNIYGEESQLFEDVLEVVTGSITKVEPSLMEQNKNYELNIYVEGYGVKKTPHYVDFGCINQSNDIYDLYEDHFVAFVETDGSCVGPQDVTVQMVPGGEIMICEGCITINDNSNGSEGDKNKFAIVQNRIKREHILWVIEFMKKRFKALYLLQSMSR